MSVGMSPWHSSKLTATPEPDQASVGTPAAWAKMVEPIYRKRTHTVYCDTSHCMRALVSCICTCGGTGAPMRICTTAAVPDTEVSMVQLQEARMHTHLVSQRSHGLAWGAQEPDALGCQGLRQLRVL